MDELPLDDSLLPEAWKSTRLIDAQVDLPPMALKLFAFSVSRLRGTEHGVRSVTFSAHELAALICDERSGDFPRELRAAATKLAGTVVRIPEWNRGGQETGSWTVTTLAAGVTYDKGSSTVKVSFSEEITPHVVHLRNRFARLDLQTVMKLRSKYAHRFYELCKSRERDKTPGGTVKPWTATLADLRAWLVLRPATKKKPAEYGRYVDFERRILLPAERELARLSGMLLSHREIKKERAVVALEFSLDYRRAPGVEPMENTADEALVLTPELPFEPDAPATLPVDPEKVARLRAIRENVAGPRAQREAERLSS